MKTTTKPIAIIVFLLATVSSAAADLPAPKSNNRKTPPNPTVRTDPAASIPRTFMSIEPNGSASEARLVIPRSVLTQLTAELDRDDSQTVAATTAVPNLSNTQTIMAGIFLSLAFGFGGIWFVHSRKRAGKLTRAALGMAILALCGATATIAYGNAGPPPVARSLTSKILVPGAQSYGAHGQVKVVIVEEGNQIKLVLPKD